MFRKGRRTKQKKRREENCQLISNSLMLPMDVRADTKRTSPPSGSDTTAAFTLISSAATTLTVPLLLHLWFLSAAVAFCTGHN